ncbi:MAG: DNA polymerase Y family protein, partial [Planctomycetota bacterium]
MDRTACIDLPSFPSQLLLRREPAWAGRPAAVLEREKPQARILWVNEEARARGVLPGMRYAAALSLDGSLCAGAVPAREIGKGVALVAETLRRFSPDVEPSREEPGLFWAGVSGLERIDPCPRAWAAKVGASLGAAGFFARVAVGFTRFGSYAVVRSPRTAVLATPEEERALALGVRLDRLDLEPDARDSLAALKVSTVEGLLRLPALGLLARYGASAYRLHRFAAADLAVPVQREELPDPLRRRALLDHAVKDAAKLLLLFARLLHPLLRALAGRGQAAASLLLEMRFDRGGARREKLVPAG